MIKETKSNIKLIIEYLDIIIHIFCSYDGSLEAVETIIIYYFILFFLPLHILIEVKIKFSHHPSSIGC